MYACVCVQYVLITNTRMDVTGGSGYKRWKIHFYKCYSFKSSRFRDFYSVWRARCSFIANKNNRINPTAEVCVELNLWPAVDLNTEWESWWMKRRLQLLSQPGLGGGGEASLLLCVCLQTCVHHLEHESAFPLKKPHFKNSSTCSLFPELHTCDYRTNVEHWNHKIKFLFLFVCFWHLSPDVKTPHWFYITVKIVLYANIYCVQWFLLHFHSLIKPTEQHILINTPWSKLHKKIKNWFLHLFIWISFPN